MKRLCVRCREYRNHRARNLCDSCYEINRRDGTIDRYPLVGNPTSKPTRYCQCAKPLVDDLPLWRTAQCQRCGYEMDPSQLREIE